MSGGTGARLSAADTGVEPHHYSPSPSPTAAGLIRNVKGLCIKHRQQLILAAYILAALLYVIYFIFALRHSIEKNVALIVMTAASILWLIYWLLEGRIEGVCRRAWNEARPTVARMWTYGRWVVLALCVLGILALIGLSAKQDIYRLVSAAGLVVFLLLTLLFSNKPEKICWRVVVTGIMLQFILGLLVLRWHVGFAVFNFAGTQLGNFFQHSDRGASFVFGSNRSHYERGPELDKHEFVFVFMPVIIMFSAFVQFLYHFGIIQYVIYKFGLFMMLVMGVNSVEAFVAAANIFVDPNTAFLAVSPFLEELTLSEFHCLLTSGFSTLTMGMVAVFASFGMSAPHLMAASVMSAPGGLVVAHLLYPESEHSRMPTKKAEFPKSNYVNWIHALSEGAYSGLGIVVHVVANVVAFMAGLEFLSVTLSWFGARLGAKNLTVQMMMSYVFMPVAFLMGVESSDLSQVAEMVGTKIFLNELISFWRLGELMNNRRAGISPSISRRSEVITTYAIGGFGTILDIGVTVAAVGVMVPSRKDSIVKVAVRAMIAGNLACYITACVAGILYTEIEDESTALTI